MSTHITTATDYAMLTRGSKGFAVVKCGAKWCNPCKKIAPAYDVLATKYPDVRWYSVDIEEVDGFVDASAVTKLPSFLLFKDGVPSGVIQGADLKTVEGYVNQLK